jgi:hypothetical protein
MSDIPVEEVFANVQSSGPNSLDEVDTNNLVSNTHLKHTTDKGTSEFILHPGDKVPESVIQTILDDVHMGEETLLEFIRRGTFVHKDNYVPDQETNKGSVEAYNQPIFRNQGHPEGEPGPEQKPAKTPAKPAEDKSTTNDAEAEADAAAKAAHDATGSGADTPAKK